MLRDRRPPAFHLRTPRESGGEEAGGIEGQPGARDSGEGAEEGDIEWTDGGQEVWRRGWGGSAALADKGLVCTVEVYRPEEYQSESQCYEWGCSRGQLQE